MEKAASARSAAGGSDRAESSGELTGSGPPGVPPVEPCVQLEAGTLVAERYLLGAPISRGGTSRVLRAEDQRLGRAVAIKFFDVARFALREDVHVARRRFFREARVVASLVHPNIVDVYDVGEVEGIPFMALRLVAGATLGRLIRDGALPAVRDALQTMLEVCQALAFAHERGVLHRDLKPDNVMVDAAGTARVLDFGLAKILQDAAETTSGIVVGTPAYLAPESLRGEAQTTATDVFSAGVTFYEYLTGRYPFTRETLCYSIAFEEPPALRSVRAGLPRSLEAVVARMMAKAAQDRYPSFPDVIHDLRRIEEHLRSGRPEAVDDVAVLAWQASAEQTQLALPFVGREAQVQAAEEAFARAGAGSGTCFAVAGDVGLGKSRLAEELVRRARFHRLNTYVGRAVETAGHHPYQPFVALLRHWANQSDVKTAEDLARTIESTWPGLRGSVGLLSGLLALSPPAPRDRDQIWETMANFLASIAAERPALIVLEDFHLADASSLNLLRYLLLGLGRQRLVLAVTYRPEGGAAHLFAELAVEETVVPMALPPLSEADVEALAVALLVETADAARLVPLLAREAGGSPLFVGELLKLLKAQEVLVARGPRYQLTRDPAISSLPQGMASVIRRRVETLSALERELVDVAAVHGDPFAPESLLPATRTDRLVGFRILNDLERRHHLLKADGPSSYRFVHERIRTFLYDEISPALRAEYHGILATHLARGAGDDDAPLVARHFEAAGRAREAGAWRRKAGDLARRTFAFEAAAADYARALELDPEGDAPPTLDALGGVQIELGRLEDAEVSFVRLLTLAEGPAGDARLEARARHGLGKIAERRGEGALAVDHASRALARLDAAAEPALASNLFALRARGLAMQGEATRARADLEEAVRVARAGAPARDLSLALYLLARAERGAGRLDEAEALLDEAQRLAQEAGDPALVVRTLQERGWLELDRGHLRRALERMEAALAEAERHGGPALRAAVRVNLAYALERVGEYPRARKEARLAYEFARATRGRRLELAALLNLIGTDIECGHLAAAQEARRAARPLAAHADEATRDALANLEGALLAEVGRTEEAGCALLAVAGRARGEWAGTAYFLLGILGLETGAAETEDWLGAALRHLEGPLVGVALRGQVLVARARSVAGRGDEEAALRLLAEVPPAALECLSVRRDVAFARALVAERRGALAEARASLEESLAVATEQDARVRRAESLLALARVNVALGRADSGAQNIRDTATLVAVIARELPEPEDRVTFISRPIFAPVRNEAGRLV